MAPAGRRQVQRLDQEGGHPSPADGRVRAEARRGAAGHDPGGDDLLDAAGEGARDVGERGRHGGRQAERASQIDRHPALGDHGRRAEAMRRAAGHDARGGDLLDRPLVPRPVVVGEPAGGGDARWGDERERDHDDGEGEPGAAKVGHMRDRLLCEQRRHATRARERATSAIGTGAHRLFEPPLPRMSSSAHGVPIQFCTSSRACWLTVRKPSCGRSRSMTRVITAPRATTSTTALTTLRWPVMPAP